LAGDEQGGRRLEAARLAVNALTLAACLRPWRGAGIHAFLRDDDGCGQGDAEFADVADAARAYDDSQGFRRSKPVAYVAAGRPGARDAGENNAGSASNIREVAAQSPPSHSASGIREVATQSPPSHSASGIREVATQSPPSHSASGIREVAMQSPPLHSASGPLPSAAQLPAPWRALLEKTRPAPLVWTYEELGNDLLGNASAERSRCLRALLADLSLPRGSSAFWPLSLPLPGDGAVAGTAAGGAGESGKGSLDAGEPGAGGSDTGESGKGNPDAGQSGSTTCGGAEFAAGVRLLDAGVVLYFGTTAALRSGFALTLRVPYTQQRAGGLQHILLPALSALAEGPEQTEKAVVYLRSVLADHPLLRARATQGRQRMWP
jgi:hypothetical protein